MTYGEVMQTLIVCGFSLAGGIASVWIQDMLKRRKARKK